MTAVQLEALLHYHYKSDDFGGRSPSTSQSSATQWALNSRLIVSHITDASSAPSIMLTPRGQFLVDYLLATPLPAAVETFEIPTR